MTTLFFEPHITGHRQEYINHLIDYIIDKQPAGKYIIVVHPDFNRQIPTLPSNCILQLATCNLQPATRNPLLRSIRTFNLADRYARQYGADHLCFLNFNDVQLALGIFRPEYSVSGILFKPFARLGKDTFRQRFTWQRKYLQTWFFVRNRMITSLFLLNDDQSADFLNRTFNTGIFRMLPDPVPELIPEPGFDIREQFGIPDDRKIFLHIGSLLKRKGTLDILDAFQFLSAEEISRFALLMLGKADDEMDTLIRNKIELLRNLQPATRTLPSASPPSPSPALAPLSLHSRERGGSEDTSCNLQPAARNLQPAARNPQPTSCIRYSNEFLPPEVFKSCIDQADLVLVPYRYAESSSGIAGHAFAAGKPLLGVEKGLLGELMTRFGPGIFIDRPGPACIADGLRRALNTDLSDKISAEFRKSHTPEAFARNIMDSLPG